MSALKSLVGRLDGEFKEFRKSAETFQVAAKQEYEARASRFQKQFVPASQRVAEIARPRLEVLIDRFQNAVDVKPVVTQHERAVTLKFNSPLARIDLTFRVGHDAEVKNLVVEQHLEILPILMEFEPGANLVMPLDKLDEDEIANWLDDRIVQFVHTVAELHQNQYYLKDHLVIDPVAGVQMPKYAAKTTLEADGKTYYFISDETKQEFVRQKKTVAK